MLIKLMEPAGFNCSRSIMKEWMVKTIYQHLKNKGLIS